MARPALSQTGALCQTDAEAVAPIRRSFQGLWRFARPSAPVPRNNQLTHAPQRCSCRPQASHRRCRPGCRVRGYRGRRHVHRRHHRVLPPNGQADQGRARIEDGFGAGIRLSPPSTARKRALKLQQRIAKAASCAARPAQDDVADGTTAGVISLALRSKASGVRERRCGGGRRNKAAELEQAGAEAHALACRLLQHLVRQPESDPVEQKIVDGPTGHEMPRGEPEDGEPAPAQSLDYFLVKSAKRSRGRPERNGRSPGYDDPATPP
jgi:hypothetical protein